MLDRETYGNSIELTTRPDLEEELSINPKLRRFFIKYLTILRTIENLPASSVPGGHLGTVLVEAYYSYRRKEMEREYMEKLDRIVYHQLVSCFRNIYKNTINMISSLKHEMPNRTVKPLKSPYDR